MAIKRCRASAHPEFSYTQLKPNDSEYLAVNRRERRLYLENGFLVQKVIQTIYGQTLYNTNGPYINIYFVVRAGKVGWGAVREIGRDRLNGVYYRFPIFRYVYFDFIVCVRRPTRSQPYATSALYYYILWRSRNEIVISFLLFLRENVPTPQKP